jgi:hypothetical protein
MAASANPLLQTKAARDPHLFCTAYKRSRFYIFGRSDREGKGDRDVFNERPTREEQTVALAPEKKQVSATSLTIHTTKGDIVSPSLYSPLVILWVTEQAERVYGVERSQMNSVRNIDMIDRILCRWRMLDRGPTGHSSLLPLSLLHGLMISTRESFSFWLHEWGIS